MKRVFAILFLSIYLISITELIELVKLPALVEHFIEHKEENSQLSFLKFLSMHYSQNDDHDGDKEKDMKLPFKSHDGCINTVSIAFVSGHFEHAILKPVFTESKSYSIHSEQFLQSSYLSSIWQPPKSC